MALPVHLADLTWEEAQGLIERDPVILVPIGSTEAHGPHLPLATDTLLSEELAARTQAALQSLGKPALIAPALSYAVTEFGAKFPGTVSISPETATALYRDVCLGLLRSGFAKICLLNSHLEPAHVTALRTACQQVEERTGKRVLFPDHTERRWARTLTEEYRRGTCHAGRYESSLLLAAHPTQAAKVRNQVRTQLPPNEAPFLDAMRRGVQDFAQAGGPRAYFGDPAQATPAEGDQIYDQLLHMVLQTLTEQWGAFGRAEPDERLA